MDSLAVRDELYRLELKAAFINEVIGHTPINNLSPRAIEGINQSWAEVEEGLAKLRSRIEGNDPSKIISLVK